MGWVDMKCIQNSTKKHLRKRPFGMPISRGEDNIKIDLMENVVRNGGG
jgi:hypothetical protein